LTEDSSTSSYVKPEAVSEVELRSTVGLNTVLNSSCKNTNESKQPLFKGKEINLQEEWENKEVKLTMTLVALDTGKRINMEALLDSGATGMFMDPSFVKKHRLQTKPLTEPVRVKNVDGTWNKGGDITQQIEMNMELGGHEERVTFEIAKIGSVGLIVGMTWLQQHNPEIDWATGEVDLSRCPLSCGIFSWLRQTYKARKNLRRKPPTDKQIREYLRSCGKEADFDEYRETSDFVKGKWQADADRDYN
jgi:hypothetical protein